MKNKIDKKTLVLIVLPITALAVGYFLFFYTPQMEVATKINQQSIPIPAQEGDEISESKMEIYEERKKRENQEAIEKSRSQVSEKDFFSMARADNFTEEKQIQEVPVQEESRNFVPETTQEEVHQEKSAPAPKKQKTAPKQTIKEQVAENIPYSEVAPPTTPTTKKGGFGIVINNNGPTISSPNKTGVTPSTTTGFIPAVLEQTMQIKNGSSVVFIVQQEFWHQEQKVNKNALLFGKARDNGETYQIQIEQIKNTNGQMLAAKNLFVFDERYSMGLQHEGTINKGLNTGVNESINEESRELTSGVASRTVTGTALNLFDKTINSMTREKQKENSISLSKGYRVFIKQN